MKAHFTKLISLVWIISLSSIIYANSSNCVSYKATKGVFFGISDIEVIGKSCDLKIDITKTTSEHLNLTLTIEPSTFDSDNDKRDKHVTEVLGGENSTPLRVFFKDLDEDFLNTLGKEKSKDLEGALEIRGKTYTLPFSISLTEDLKKLEVTATSKLSNLNIKLSNVAGGLIAKPRDQLELQGSISIEFIKHKIEQLKTN
ncbi:MAG: hypothetical protein HOO06_16150 [Bdellovibrionaceae bacterium]|jgi:hypothetical protein|nr:hypothetical protein [Pseudobdellovibrionaceae bacterium]